ncbi:MAG: hypothetical protein PVSMB1_13840 [Gemmatimonadaceae bacterium]
MSVFAVPRSTPIAFAGKSAPGLMNEGQRIVSGIGAPRDGTIGGEREGAASGKVVGVKWTIKRLA